MRRRQTSIPRAWLIADERMGKGLWAAVRRLPRSSGVLVLFHELGSRDRRRLLGRLRQIGRTKGLTIVDEAAGGAKRVHDAPELRRALLARTPFIMLSPLYPTASHPDWQALPRMRAAALARLAQRHLIALGGMNERRFRRVQRLGFIAWAGIDAFRT